MGPHARLRSVRASAARTNKRTSSRARERRGAAAGKTLMWGCRCFISKAHGSLNEGSHRPGTGGLALLGKVLCMRQASPPVTGFDLCVLNSRAALTLDNAITAMDRSAMICATAARYFWFAFPTLRAENGTRAM